MTGVAERLARVQDRIAAAEARAGRPPGSATLVAVTKTHPPERVLEGVAAGLRVLGENRVQEAVAKVAAVPEATWHLVGHLQRNKAAQAVDLFALIHSLDSERLARRLDRLGRERQRPVETLVQVNLSGEDSKYGVTEQALPHLLDACVGLEGLRVLGLMSIPAPSPDPEASRPDFIRLRTLREREARRERPGVDLRHLSMGMTDDFEVAVEEGATLIRVGRALFGPRRVG